MLSFDDLLKLKIGDKVILLKTTSHPYGYYFYSNTGYKLPLVLIIADQLDNYISFLSEETRMHQGLNNRADEFLSTRAITIVPYNETTRTLYTSNK